MATIKVKNKEIIVDDEDFEYLNQWKWKIHPARGYAMRSSWNKEKKSSSNVIYMARDIVKPPKGMQVDHINGNRLDNRKINLRICSHIQNMQNRKGYSKYGFKGIQKMGNKYIARIIVNRKYIGLGSYMDAKIAAKAYNQAALRYFGEFARLNQI